MRDQFAKYYPEKCFRHEVSITLSRISERSPSFANSRITRLANVMQQMQEAKKGVLPGHVM